MKRLYLVTHKGTNHKTHVAAESMEHVANNYDGTAKKIELIDDKVVVLKNKAHDNSQEDNDIIELKNIRELIADDLMGSKDSYKVRTISEYFKYLKLQLIEALSSNRGHISTFDGFKEREKKMMRIIEDALATEEKHYDSNDSLPGWIIEAKDLIIK